MNSDFVNTIAMAALLGLLAGCGDRDASDAQTNAQKPETKDCIVVEGELKRSMSLTMIQPGHMQANRPDLTLVTDEGKEYPVRQMPGCFGGIPEPSDGVISLGGLGRYRCKGVITGSVLEVYEMTSITKDYFDIEGVIKHSMPLTQSPPGHMQANPPNLTLVTDEGKEYPVHRMPGCTGGPPEPSGGAISLGGLGRYRCRGLTTGSVLDVYEMTKITTARVEKNPGTMPLVQTSLEYDGVYRSIEKHAGTMPYWSYLRFYPDGEVIAVSSTGQPKDLRGWFSKENQPHGKVTIQGNRISFRIPSRAGAVDYIGEAYRDCIRLGFYSHINHRMGSDVYVSVEW